MCLHICCVPLGAVSAVHKCVLDVPGVLAEALDQNMIVKMLSLLEEITLLLLSMLYGDENVEDKGTLSLLQLSRRIRRIFTF